MRHSYSCIVYGHENEDASHALRNCVATKEMWKLIVPREQQTRFFFEPFQNWLITNLYGLVRLQEHGVMWVSLFGLIAWRIWKSRYLFIFQNISWSPMEIIKASLSWARQVEASHNFSRSNGPNPHLNKHFEEKRVLLSTDGAVERNSKNAAADGVVRDREGNWIIGVTHHLGNCSPFEAEL